MATFKKRISFFDSELGLEIAQTLQLMTKDSSYNTKSSYSANSTLYPNHLMSFVDKHMNYLNTYPSINPYHYVSNLRLITRVSGI
jgi:hypothetical protein